MKVAISTIAKNEAKNVKAFVEACKGADLVSVLDTGSTDGTQKLLKKYGAFAGEAKFKTFRFDVARNKALDLLPKDIDVVVSIDMDERLQPGWRQALERAWQPNMQALSYWYIGEWQDEKKTIPAVPTWRTKIFKRHGFKWFRPVHEIPLLKDGSYPSGGLCREIEVRHYQKGERNYEPLLTQLIKSDPKDTDAYIQRGAEWMRMGEYKKAITDYEKYLELTATGTKVDPASLHAQLVAGRRAYSHIGIAQAKHLLGYAPEVIVGHFIKSVAECPQLREAWTYLADGMFAVGNYPAAYGAAMTALNIKENGIHTMDMRCWGDFPQQLADNAFAKILAGTASPKTLSLQGYPSTQGGYRMGQSIADEDLAGYFGELVSSIEKVQGDIVECGVCHGYSFTQIATAVYKSKKKRKLYGLDVWGVMPKLSKEDASVVREQGITEDLARFDAEGAQGSMQEVRERLVAAGIPKKWIDKNVVLIKGDIKNTLPKLKSKKFALVHLDVDLYSAYKAALPHVWPKLQKGGVLALDEYGDPWWPGANKAVNEYFAKQKGNYEFEGMSVGQTARYYVVKK